MEGGDSDTDSTMSEERGILTEQCVKGGDSDTDSTMSEERGILTVQ